MVLESIMSLALIKSFFKIFFYVDCFLKSLLNLLQYCFCFLFCFFDREECGLLALPPGIEPTALALEDEVPTAETRTLSNTTHKSKLKMD